MNTEPITEHITEATIEADAKLPIIRITRDFAATPAQLWRAHTDPELFARWVGPDGMDTKIVEWDVRDGGAWRYVASRDGVDYGFRGCFHQVTDERIVQTFTFEGMPDGVALETLRFEDLGDGYTRLHAQSLVDSFEARDAWLASGMETGVNEGYAKLEALLIDRAETPAERYARVAAGFDARVRGMSADAWDRPSPCAGWSGRDVVAHLVGWIPAVIGRAGIEFPAMDACADPVAAWAALDATLRTALDDPDAANVRFDAGPPGELTVAHAIAMLVVGDLFLHTWDLARTGGLDERLDPVLAAEMLAGMEPLDEMLRASGHYGPRVAVPDDADAQTRLIAFSGRSPDRPRARSSM